MRPLEILRYAATFGPAPASVVEHHLRLLDCEAVVSAPEIPGARDAVTYLRNAGYTITIVSNNSAQAIRTYLLLHDLRDHVRRISARTDADVSMLKPNSFLLRQAVDALGTMPERCRMICGSATDIRAARGAGVPAIAYAPPPRQPDGFRSERPAAIIGQMSELVMRYTAPCG